MRAISLWQPWASAMADRLKLNETRGRATSYRGDLVICSALRKPRLAECDNDLKLYQWALAQPFGCALCVVELYDCVPTEYFVKEGEAATGHLRPITEKELSLGNYQPRRFAWMTRNLRKLKTPIPTKGFQGFWFLPVAAVEDIQTQIRA